jgi:hypothetical protein
MLKKILITLIAIIVAFLIFVATKPSEISIERSIVISKSPQKIYPLINNQMKWSEWSPWNGLDGNIEEFFGGATEGLGSYYKWNGNDLVGAGTSTIVENQQDNFVKFKWDFEKPMKATYFSEFKLAKQEGGVQVTWTMYGKRDFISKLAGLFMDCEEKVGGEFEKGLKNLKDLAEKS